MARRKVIWHIGPVDPGTAFLAEALATAAPELAEHGIAVPGGAWHRIEDEIWRHKGISVLSTPRVARAAHADVDLRLTGLRDLEVHLVLLVRELPCQVYSAWQDGLRHGSTISLKRYAARVMDPQRSYWQAEDFWAGRDLAELLPRWTRAFHADRVHVIDTPSDPDAIWSALLDQTGLDQTGLDQTGTGAIARPGGPVDPMLAADLDPTRVGDITTGWAKLVADRGFDLHGPLRRTPDAVVEPASRGDQLEAVAELLTRATTDNDRLATELARLREENARLDRKRRKHRRRVRELKAR